MEQIINEKECRLCTKTCPKGLNPGKAIALIKKKIDKL